MSESAPAAPKPKSLPPRHLRAPIEIRVEITRGPQSFTTTSCNLAAGGIKFESQEHFNAGDEVNVLLYIPVDKDLELLKVAAKVVWSKEDFGCWMIGARFVKFAPGDERRLRAWLLQCIRAQKEGRPL